MLTAPYHEGGHAIVGPHVIANRSKSHKATIIPRAACARM